MGIVTVLKIPGDIAKTDMRNGVAVVIDVLRATSSIVHAMTSGCEAVIPAMNKAEAQRLLTMHPNALLCGEEGGRKIPGFDIGNSPQEYSFEAVGGKTLILTTSNGTKAILGAKSRGAGPIFVCSFLNLGAVADAVSNSAASSVKDVFVVCSGAQGEYSHEDYICAGGVAHLLAERGFEPDREAEDAGAAYLGYDGDILRALLDSPHGRDLERIGFASDLPYCSKVSVERAVPYLTSSGIKDYTSHRA